MTVFVLIETKNYEDSVIGIFTTRQKAYDAVTLGQFFNCRIEEAVMDEVKL